jgi:two-component system LytT family response regulator
MKKLSTIIVGGELAGRDHTRELCDRHPELEVIAQCSGPGEAHRLILEHRPDLALLDIEMHPMTGLELATGLPVANAPMIVFVTAYDRHANRAFELNAVDFLLKPLNESRFSETVQRAVTRYRGSEGTLQPRRMMTATGGARDESAFHAAAPDDRDRILVEIGSRAHFVEIASIESVETNKNNVSLCTKTQTYTVRASFRDLEPHLPRGRFIRVNRSVMVNTRHITVMDKIACGVYEIQLQSGRCVTSTRTFWQRVEGPVLRKRSEL